MIAGLRSDTIGANKIAFYASQIPYSTMKTEIRKSSKLGSKEVSEGGEGCEGEGFPLRINFLLYGLDFCIR